MLLSVRIDRRELLADGAAFGGVGPYEKLVGTAQGEVDPSLPCHQHIALVELAPRNARGAVEYASDFYVLRPLDPARGNGRLLYEVNNRGRKMLFGNLADGPQGVNDPRTLAELGNAFPLRRGYTLAWSGWDPDAPRANGGLALQAPVASEHGRPLVRTIREEFVSSSRMGVLDSFRLSHEADTLDPSQARLTVRERERDARRVLDTAQWRFVDARTIRLLPEGAGPLPGALYEFHYRARHPKVGGLGFAATRDVVSWLRHERGGHDLLGRLPTHVLALGISQSARYLRHHISAGFNRDEQGRRVFDGVLAHIAGSGRLFFNLPFAQPFRTNTQHEDHDFPENAFPFSAAEQVDPLTGGRGALLTGDASDPLLMETNTSTEYWQKGASLLHTDPLGTRDVPSPPGARVYLIAGTQHAGRAGAPVDPGPNANARNPHNPMPALRALMVALEEWVVDGRAPPPSRVPTLRKGTLVSPRSLAFPDIPGVTVPTSGNRIAPPGDWVHPVVGERAYTTLVCQVDADGNELAGIRLPDIAVPLGTYTGWNTYRAAYLGGELADRDGSWLPFAPDADARAAAGDPRPSLAERYTGREDYVARLRTCVDALLSERLLLSEDAERYIERARTIPFET